MATWLRPVFVVLALFSITGAEQQPPRRPMEELSGGLAVAFRATLDEDREALGAGLRRLAAGTDGLLAHGETFGKTTARLREAIARDATQALAAYEAGRFDAAERRVHQMVDHCFACHTRMPAGSSALGERLARDVALPGLGLRDRVFFLVATRQFEAALDATEKELRTTSASGRPTAWLFEAYLKLALRVSSSPGRARVTLEAYLERTAPAPYLESRIRAWIDALSVLESRGEVDPSLAAARALIDEGRLQNAFPADKRGLVQLIAASGMLLAWLEHGEGDTAARAEAWYLLGVAESYISSTLWTDQTDHFLEQAIRLDPHSELAARAHEFLIDYVIARHSSASETFVPDDVQARLDELEALAAPQ